MSRVDIPDEVRCAAYTEAKRTGHFPQWFLDLQAGKHVGRVPGCRRPKHDSMARGVARAVGVGTTTMTAADAVGRAVSHLGGRKYTRRDATRVMLGYADLTFADGRRAPGPLVRPERWRQSFALKLSQAIRGILL